MKIRFVSPKIISWKRGWESCEKEAGCNDTIWYFASFDVLLMLLLMTMHTKTPKLLNHHTLFGLTMFVIKRRSIKKKTNTEETLPYIQGETAYILNCFICFLLNKIFFTSASAFVVIKGNLLKQYTSKYSLKWPHACVFDLHSQNDTVEAFIFYHFRTISHVWQVEADLLEVR